MRKGGISDYAARHYLETTADWICNCCFFHLPSFIFIYIYIWIYFSISFSNKLIVKSFNWIYTIIIICTTISSSFSFFNSINLDILLHYCLHYSFFVVPTFNNKIYLVANGNQEFVLVVVVLYSILYYSLFLSRALFLAQKTSLCFAIHLLIV